MTRAAVRTFIAICAIVALGPAVRSQEPQFSVERPIKTTGAGPHRLQVDATLLSRGQPFLVMQRGDRWIAEGGLSDLRLFDDSGGAVPYLLIQPRSQEPEWLPATMLPLPVTKTSSGFEADFGEATDVNALRVEGLRAPFLKRVTLEGSGDRERWTVLIAEGTLFDLPNERLRQTSLGFQTTRVRYLRVTWNDTNSGRVGMPRAVMARRAAGGPAPVAATEPVPFERRTSEPSRSRYVIRLPGARLPVVALDLTIGGGHVFRQAVVLESRLTGFEAEPFELGRATLTRVVRDDAAAASLRVPIRTPTEAEVDLVIEDGANPPLDVTGVSMVFAELPEIYFEAPAGPVVARYGNRTLSAPTYDLEAARRSIDLSSVSAAMWGSAVMLSQAAPAPEAAPAPPAGADLDPALFQHSRSIEGTPGLAALTLDATVLANSTGPSSRFSDVRILDESNRQIPYLVERRDEPQSIALTLERRDAASIPELKPRAGRQSLYAVTLPSPGLPRPRIVLETSERVFQRSIRIGVERPPDRRHRDTWFADAGSAHWRHADRQTPAPALSIDIGETDGTTLLIVVDEGDNAALPLSSARLLLPTYRLRFYHPDSGSLRLLYGRKDLQPPQYDLALLAPQVMGAAAAPATASPATSEPGAAEPSRSSIISPLMFWILLGGAVLVLLSLIVKLVRTDSSA